jgi:hypothetical protein
VILLKSCLVILQRIVLTPPQSPLSVVMATIKFFLGKGDTSIVSKGFSAPVKSEAQAYKEITDQSKNRFKIIWMNGRLDFLHR